LWGRVQDAVAAATGVVGSATSQANDGAESDVMDLIFWDHQKVKTLISEIRSAETVEQIKSLFGQLYRDLTVHSRAEEDVVYPAVRPFYGDSDTKELYDEQAEMDTLLNEMKTMNSTGTEFMAKLKQLKAIVGDHTRQEESTMFTAMRRNLSLSERQVMAKQFKASKQKLQSEVVS
jgi:hemerythrin superfamily protein